MTHYYEREPQVPGVDDEAIDQHPTLDSSWKSVAEVAACLSVSEETVEKAIDAGHLIANEEKRIFFSDVVLFLLDEEKRRTGQRA